MPTGAETIGLPFWGQFGMEFNGEGLRQLEVGETGLPEFFFFGVGIEIEEECCVLGDRDPDTDAA